MLRLSVVMTMLLLLASSLRTVAHAQDVQLPAGHEQVWQRYATFTVPPLTTEVTVDGHVEVREWLGASMMGYSLEETTGVAIEDRTRVYFAYQEDQLLVAFVFHRPEHNLTPSLEDRFELTLDVSHDGQQPIVITGNHAELLKVIGTSQSDALRYAARVTDLGWEGELVIPLRHRGGLPLPGTIWGVNLRRLDQTPLERQSGLAYTGRYDHRIHKFAHAMLGTQPAGVHVQAGWLEQLQAQGAFIEVSNFSEEKLTLQAQGELRLTQTSQRMPYFPLIDDATTDDLGQPNQVDVSDQARLAAEAYKQVASDQKVWEIPPRQTRLFQVAGPTQTGHALASYELRQGEQLIAAGVTPFEVPDPLTLDIQSFFMVGAIEYRVGLRGMREKITPGSRLSITLLDQNGKELGRHTRGELVGQREVAGAFRFSPQAAATYSVHVSLVNGDEVLGERTASAAMPAEDRLPMWWTMDAGLTPAVPPPWTALSQRDGAVTVLGRKYAMGPQGLPVRMESWGRDVLAGPVALVGTQPWESASSACVSQDEQSATFVAKLQKQGVRAMVTNRVEFDGFMLIDVELAGDGSLDALSLEIPLAGKLAKLMQTYRVAPGPGPAVFPRHVGKVPDVPYAAPPFITCWIGDERGGVEWSCESTRGWSMTDPSTAMRVQKQGDRVVLTLGLISRPVQLSDEPRRIRFGLVATPTKTLLPHVQKARLFDDVRVALLPGDWSGFFVWHPPVVDPQQIEKTRSWVESVHAEGKKLLVNGGWAASVQDADNMPWVPEMFRSPISNASFGKGQQYAQCWKSPFGKFLYNSFAYNARQFGFDGVRFDTVVPWFPCQSLAHDCGWFDDEGNLRATYNIYAQREVWKRLYRIFHGQVIQEGLIYTPVAAGPIMAVHSFSDVREVGEGFYQKSDTIREGYPGDLVRSVMTGTPYGERVVNNLKMGPLFYNQRIGALLVHNAEPRFNFDYGAGYAAHAQPSVQIEDAWAWVDRFNAQWITLDDEDSPLRAKGESDGRILAGLHWNAASHRALLIVTNQHLQPMVADVQVDPGKLGWKGPVYAQDAVGFGALPISSEGGLTLPLLGQGYRLIQISNEPPRFGEQALGPNLLTSSKGEHHAGWRSEALTLEPGLYLAMAELKIEATMGQGSSRPNEMGRFSPSVRHGTALSIESKAAASADPRVELRTMIVRHWQPTPGWWPVALPFRITTAAEARIVLAKAGMGEAMYRHVRLHRVKE